MHYCCIDCFKQKDIKKLIKNFQLTGSCNYCGKQNVNIASTKEIGRFIRESLDKAYEELGENTGSMYDSEEKMYINCYGEKAGTSIRDILFFDEDIFVNTTGTEQLFLDLFDDSGMSQKDKMEGEIDKFEDIEDDLFVIRNALYGEEGINEYYEWEEFKHLVKYYNRFFDINPKNRKRMDLLTSLEPYFKRMSINLEKGSILYRVRKMDIQSASQLNSMDLYKELSPAPPEFATNNRMSPTGISYLYVATQPQTSYKECRLHDGDRAVQAKFVTKCNLNILDLSKKVCFIMNNSIFSEYYNPDLLWINDFLNNFEDEISRPVNPNKDKSYEYVATQIVAEYVRSLGYDGIKYRSSVSAEGSNYVFFCGPNKDISGIIYDSDYGVINYCALKFFTDWFWIKDVKVIKIKENVITNVSSEDLFFVSKVKRSDINAADVFSGYIGSFTYSILEDIEEFIKDMPKELMKDSYEKHVSDDIIQNLLESIGEGNGEIHQFSCNKSLGFLDIEIDRNKYQYSNGKSIDDYIKPINFDSIK